MVIYFTLDRSDFLAVGDSLEHDIAGASAAGMDSCFIAGGIHKDEVLKGEDVVDIDALQGVCRHHKAMPSYVMPFLRW